MLRLINAFLSGGDYLPCRQIFQKCLLLRGMVYKYIKLGKTDLAIERANMFLETREVFNKFLNDQEGRTTLLFENNDTFESQDTLRKAIDDWAKDVMKWLEDGADCINSHKI